MVAPRPIVERRRIHDTERTRTVHARRRRHHRARSGRRSGWHVGLGDTSFGLRGKTPDGARVQMFVWRVGNLILAVSGSDPVAPAEVRALADLVNGRTS